VSYFARYAADVVEKKKATEFHIIAHSMGGVVAYLAIGKANFPIQ